MWNYVFHLPIHLECLLNLYLEVFFSLLQLKSEPAAEIEREIPKAGAESVTASEASDELLHEEQKVDISEVCHEFVPYFI